MSLHSTDLKLNGDMIKIMTCTQPLLKIEEDVKKMR